MSRTYSFPFEQSFAEIFPQQSRHNSKKTKIKRKVRARVHTYKMTRSYNKNNLRRRLHHSHREGFASCSSYSSAIFLSHGFMGTTECVAYRRRARLWRSDVRRINVVNVQMGKGSACRCDPYWTGNQCHKEVENIEDCVCSNHYCLNDGQCNTWISIVHVQKKLCWGTLRKGSHQVRRIPSGEVLRKRRRVRRQRV